MISTDCFDAVKSFENYSLLLSQGQHVEEISLWMSELILSNACLPTILSILQSANPTSVTSFLAGKVMHDFLLNSCGSSIVIDSYSDIFQILLKYLNDHISTSNSPSYKQIVRSVAAITILTAEMGVLSPDKIELHKHFVNALSDLSQQSSELKLVVLRVLEDIQADLSKVKAAIKARIPGCVSSSGSLAYVKSLVLHVSHHILESYISHTLQASSSGVVDISISRVPVEYQSLVAIQWLLDVLSAWSTTYSFQEAMNTLQSTLIPRHTDKITLLDVADPTESSLLKHFPLVIHLLVYQLSYPNTSPETQSIRITVLATLLEILHTWLHFHVNLESIMKSELDMYPYINTLFILYLGILEVWDTIFTGSINTNMMSISDIFSLNLYPCIHQCDNTREAYYSLFTSLVEVTATFAENHKCLVLDLRDDRINGCRRQALVVYLDITAVLLPSICTSALSSTILNVVRGSEEGVTHFYRLSLASTLLHSLTVPCVSVASVVCETITYLPDRLLSSSSSASSGCDTDIRRSNLIARTRTNELQFCSLIASNVLHALEIQSLAPGEVPAQLWVQFLANRNLLKENKNGSGDAVSIELEEQMEDVLAFRSESAEMVIAMFRGECSVGGWVGGHQILTMGIDQLIKYLDTIRLISASYDPVPIAPISNTTNNITTLMEAYALTEISLHLFSHFVDEVNVLWFMLGDEEEKNEELGRNEISYGRVTEIQCSVLMQLLGSIRLIAEFMDSRHHYFFQFSSSPTIHIDNNIHSVTTVERGSSFQSLAFYYLEMWQYAPAILSAAWSLQSQEILLVNTCDLLELSLAAIKFMCQCLGVASLRKPAARSLLALITRLQSHLVSQAESICMWLSQALLQADTQQILRDEPLLAEKLHACHSRMACIVSDPESQYQIFITSFTALIQGLGQAVHTLSEVFNKQLLSLQSTQQQLSASVPSGHIFQLLSEVLYLQRSLIGFLEGFCQATISSEIDSKLKTLVSVAVGTLLQITEHTSILLACLSYSVNSFSSGSFSRADEQLMSLYVSVVDNCSFAMSRLISIHLSTEFALHGSHQLQSIVYNSHTLVSAYPSKSQSSLRHLSAICRSLLQISELFCTTSTTTSTGTSTSTLSFGSSTVDYSIGSIQISAFASMAALLSYATTLLRLQSVLQSSLSSPTALNGAVNESAMLLLQKCVKTVRDILNENPSLVNIQLPYGFLLNQPDDPFCQFIIPAIANIYAQVLSNNCSVGDGMTLRRLPYDSILVSYLMLCCQHLSAGSITLSSVSSIVAVSVSRQFASLWVRLVGTNATDNNNKSEIAWFQQEFIYLYLFQLCCRSDLPASSRLVECFVALLEWSYTSVDVLTCNQCVEQAASKARSQIILFPSDDKIAKYNARLNDVLTTIENYVLLHRDSSIIKSDLVKICC